MSDSTTTVAHLKSLMADFVAKRDWRQFHSPKNLSMSLAIEAAELMEHFQWVSTDESRLVADSPKKIEAIGEELADVVCYALALANELNLDLSTTIQHKVTKNEKKYPVEEYRGRFDLDDARD
jgi:dCTP diphosphatase